MENNKFGFIITRHVNSVKTNNYWNNCVKLLRSLYPSKKIVIIDDNSNYDYVSQNGKRILRSTNKTGTGLLYDLNYLGTMGIFAY